MIFVSTSFDDLKTDLKQFKNSGNQPLVRALTMQSLNLINMTNNLLAVFAKSKKKNKPKISAVIKLSKLRKTIAFLRSRQQRLEMRFRDVNAVGIVSKPIKPELSRIKYGSVVFGAVILQQ